MPERAKPKPENYVECPTCTKDAGEPVVYHKRSLQASDSLFDDPEQTCPLGHVIPKVPA